jgi:pimeloyl-ACP methyl ester carboxylesterase
VILIAGRMKAGGSVIQLLGTGAFIIKSFFVGNARYDFWSTSPKSMLESGLGQLLTDDALATKGVTRQMLMGMAPLMNMKPIMRGSTRIGVPTLVIHGEGDTVNPPDGSRQLYNNLTVPQKKLVMIPDMNHDLDDLGAYIGPGLTKPLTPNASRIVEEIVAWVQGDHV